MEQAIINSGSELFHAGGPVATRLATSFGSLRGLRPWVNEYNQPMQANALLRKEEWAQVDAAVLDIATLRTAAITDLRAQGLVQTGGGLGLVMSQYETISDMDPALVSMSGTAAGRNDRVDFALNSVPVPIIHKDFSLNIRHLMASRNLVPGGGAANIDTTQVQTASRLVQEGVENMIFNGNTIVVNGAAIYGLTTHPQRNIIATSQPWTTPSNIYPSITAAIGALVADRFYGPYMVYVSNTQYVQMLAPEGVDVFSTVLNRVLSTPRIMGVSPTFALADHNLIVVSMTRATIDAIEAVSLTPVQWNEQGGMIINYKVMTAFVPRIKADANGNCGVVHHTGV
jgi:uncharacterized linocin/CFP29 family protein